MSLTEALTTALGLALGFLVVWSLLGRRRSAPPPAAQRQRPADE